jgi:hypothetical protein
MVKKVPHSMVWLGDANKDSAHMVGSNGQADCRVGTMHKVNTINFALQEEMWDLTEQDCPGEYACRAPKVY